METLIKYPRTPHLEGSRLQIGDEDCSQVPYSALAGKYIVVEEKLDGANSGLRFNANADMLLQSRGHYLTGGGREKHFKLMQSWAAVQEERLFDLLGQRYLMYGEWMQAKHTVFYDRLPHYFLEFDLFDVEEGIFLSTTARHEILAESPIVSVPVLFEGIAPRRLQDLLSMLRPSLAKSATWRESLKETALRQGLDPARIERETDASDLSEGLYVKVEDGRQTVDRMKWVRSDFLQTIADNDSHWLSRPVVPNQLAPGVDLFAAEASCWAVPSDMDVASS